MNDSYTRACHLYISEHKSTKHLVLILQAVIDGLSLDDVIRQRICPNLAINSVSKLYYKAQRLVATHQ